MSPTVPTQDFNKKTSVSSLKWKLEPQISHEKTRAPSCIGYFSGMIIIHKVVVSNIYNVHPYLGKISNLTNIFQRGWFNHQLVYIIYIYMGMIIINPWQVGFLPYFFPTTPVPQGAVTVVKKCRMLLIHLHQRRLCNAWSCWFQMRSWGTVGGGGAGASGRRWWSSPSPKKNTHPVVPKSYRFLFFVFFFEEDEEKTTLH